jgi:hypothetical protein
MTIGMVQLSSRWCNALSTDAKRIGLSSTVLYRRRASPVGWWRYEAWSNYLPTFVVTSCNSKTDVLTGHTKVGSLQTTTYGSKDAAHTNATPSIIDLAGRRTLVRTQLWGFPINIGPQKELRKNTPELQGLLTASRARTDATLIMIQDELKQLRIGHFHRAIFADDLAAVTVLLENNEFAVQSIWFERRKWLVVSFFLGVPWELEWRGTECPQNMKNITRHIYE